MRRAALAAALVALVLTVAGCTGVPGSSSPQVVRTVGLGETPAPSAPAPPAGASPTSIVQGFIDAMSTSPDQLDAARAYLDDDAATRWSGSTVTIVRQSPFVVGAEDPATHQVKVSYQPIGTLSADGVYSPATLQGLGYGVAPPATYALARNAAGEWRITTPVPVGLYITDRDFAARYTPKALYFLDAAGTRLVPDLRYSALSEPSLETYLLRQLAQGPRQELEGAVSPFDPVPTGNQQLSVTPGSPTVVQIPGAAALQSQARYLLAAQIAFTLRPTSFQSELQIQDRNQVVDIPDVGGTFDVGDFGALAPVVDTADATVTYVRGGVAVDSDGRPLAGAFGSARYGLDSAVFDGDGGSTLLAGTSGTTGDTGRRRLLVGDSTGLRDAGVPEGPLTSPAWAPIGTTADVDEVWVGSGGQIYRYLPGQNGSKPTVVPIGGQNTIPGTISSLSFSPEGSRLALVIRSPDGTTSQVWLASVARNGPDVQLGTLLQITPSGYQIADVGWRSETTLAAVGTSSAYSAGAYLEVAVDGSRLEASATDGLPDRPLSLAVSPNSPVQWVTVGTGSGATVWNRTSPLASWSSPAGGSPQLGSAPAFSV